MPTPSESAIKSAASWQAKLWSQTATEQDIQACLDWRKSTSENEQAWQLVAQITRNFQHLNEQSISSQVLADSKLSRRTLLKVMVLFAITPAVGYFSYTNSRYAQSVLADYATNIGEIREYQLADGTQISLNTQTAINIVFDKKQRLISLIQGEIFISTGKDINYQDLPFYVKTEHGLIQALGTRFNVRSEPKFSYVNVEQDTVLITSQQQVQQLNQGQQIYFDTEGLQEVSQATHNSHWRNKKLVAEQMSLQQFANELSRYRYGVIRCDPQIAHLTISGIFSLEDTDQALASLALSLPIKVEKTTSLWITLVPK